MKIKTSPRYHFSLSDWQRFVRLVTYWLVRFEKASNHLAGENAKLYNLYGEKMAIIIKIKNAYTL